MPKVLTTTLSFKRGITMAHVITELCIHDGTCTEVCPVECIVVGEPVEQWPWSYIDADTCIDCGACVSECPENAIYPVDEVPEQYQAAIAKNKAFFSEGPGYKARG
jgi:ferredoxin